MRLWCQAVVHQCVGQDGLLDLSGPQIFFFFLTSAMIIAAAHLSWSWCAHFELSMDLGY